MDAKSLALLFREAVAFDFKKEKITSYAQVRRGAEAFYTLLNRDAFLAMLNDYLASDNQLLDIFVDLHDAGLGIQKMSEKAFQDSPRLIIAQFITQPKYAYHQNDVGKVYMAINTWLNFFGAPEATPEWTKCPLCGGTVKTTGDRSCGTCKKKSTDFVSIMAELSMMLETERSGKGTPSPAYWDLIKTGSEFYVEYKLEIENRRSQRTFEQHEEDQQALAEALYEAEKIINSFYARVDLETGKDKPDFDALMRELIKDPAISEASKLHNEAFTKKLSDLKRHIEEKKKAYLSQKEQNAQAQTFQSALKGFLESLANLEQDLTAHALTLYRFKTLFDSVSRTYTKIMAMVSNGHEIAEPETKRALNRFDKTIREQAKQHLTTLEMGQKVDEQQKKLLAKVSEVLNAFNGVSPAENRSAELTEKFMKEIENADAFEAYRVAQPAKYNELVAPIREKLSELIQAEKQILLDVLEKKIKDLLKEIESAPVTASRGEFYQKQLDSLKRGSQFAELKKHRSYIDGVQQLAEAIAKLKHREAEYQQEQKAKRDAELAEKQRRIAIEDARTKAKRSFITRIFLFAAIIAVALAVLVIVLVQSGAIGGMITKSPLFGVKSQMATAFYGGISHLTSIFIC